MRYIIPFLLLLLGCGPESRATREWTPDDHGHPPAPPEGQGVPEAAPEVGTKERAVRALWNVSCASCHGQGGRGDGVQPPPGAQMPDFASAAFQNARTDAQLLQVIREGRGMMPAFGKQVNEEGLAALVLVVRGFGPAPTPTPAAPGSETGEPAGAPSNAEEAGEASGAP